MKFSFKNSNNEKIKQKKVKKKLNEIKIDIKNNVLLKNKTITQVFKFSTAIELCRQIENTDSNRRLKILINYNTDEFYLLKSENIKGKKQPIEDNNRINNKEIAGLIKSFYSEDKVNWDDSFCKNKKKLKQELAPAVFDVKDNYILTDKRYLNVISLEHINQSLNIQFVLKNTDSWLSIDCYKIDKDFILNKLSDMKNDDTLSKKFSDFILARLDDIIRKIQEEIIFQCEIKLLSYNSDLEVLLSDNATIRNRLYDNYCTSYVPQEKINTRKLFEKCIYPDLKMDIIHSINSDNLFKMIGCDN